MDWSTLAVIAFTVLCAKSTSVKGVRIIGTSARVVREIENSIGLLLLLRFGQVCAQPAELRHDALFIRICSGDS